jgi:glucose-6-phosphate isomerase
MKLRQTGENSVFLDVGKRFVFDAGLREKTGAIIERLMACEPEMSKWVRYPAEIPEELMCSIKNRVSEVNKSSDALVVIGIGGSYMGTRAVYEALGDRGAVSDSDGQGTDLIFAGHDFSSAELGKTLVLIKEKDVSLCVISKSGTTMETSLFFAILKRGMREKYGDAYCKRIIIISEDKENPLTTEAAKNGYSVFQIPEGIGGRYSVFTPVGLVPLAAAGIDIDAFVAGAADVLAVMNSDASASYRAVADYAMARYSLMSSGKGIEIFEYADPSLFYFCEWIKQLFAESEGKAGKGLFPVSLAMPADLHSMGQFLQEGRQLFFETVIDIKNDDYDYDVGEVGNELFDGRKLSEIRKAMFDGVAEAHEGIGVPRVTIELKEKNAYSLGQLMYIFMLTAGTTGMLMGVDPFDQPGVENYKKAMKKRL